MKLHPIDKKTYQAPHSLQSYSIQFDGTRCQVLSSDSDLVLNVTHPTPNEVQLTLQTRAVDPTPDMTWVTFFDFFFGHFNELQKVTLTGVDPRTSTSFLSQFEFEKGLIQVSRAEFYQLPAAWHRTTQYAPLVEKWTLTQDRAHPVRSRTQAPVFYRRYVPAIGKTITFRAVDVDKDLLRFHAWHNDPRVYDLWDLNKPIDELRTYLEKGLRDPHQIPLILEFDGTPIGYFEVYWAPEDRLGPYYPSEPYDRGFHFLIGNPEFLGVANTGEAVRSIMHLIFLEDARTRRVVAEPRADNKRVLKYVQLVPGWKFIKEFDFPHKRAALLMAKREDFFMGGAL